MKDNVDKLVAIWMGEPPVTKYLIFPVSGERMHIPRLIADHQPHTVETMLCGLIIEIDDHTTYSFVVRDTGEYRMSFCEECVRLELTQRLRTP
jgi:hypothetical protein